MWISSGPHSAEHTSPNLRVLGYKVGYCKDSPRHTEKALSGQPGTSTQQKRQGRTSVSPSGKWGWGGRRGVWTPGVSQLFHSPGWFLFCSPPAFAKGLSQDPARSYTSVPWLGLGLGRKWPRHQPRPEAVTSSGRQPEAERVPGGHSHTVSVSLGLYFSLLEGKQCHSL